MPDTRTIRPSDHSTLLLWKAERDHLYAALILLGQNAKAHALLNCGNIFYRWRCWECDKPIDLVQSCDLRLCPRCSIRRAYRFIQSYKAVLDTMTAPKLLTLTFKSVLKLTKYLVKLCFKLFARLRRLKLWRDRVAGGMAGLEFTYTSAGWHPHIHALIDSAYIPQRLLSTAWNNITKGSYIVYIQAADRYKGVYEVAKYVAKGNPFYSKPHLVHSYLRSTYKTRFFTTFGSFHGQAQPPQSAWHLSPPPGFTDDDDPLPPWLPRVTSCPFCGSQAVSAYGLQEHSHIDPPPFQIPF